MQRKTFIFSTLALALGLAGPARAETEIQWWHAMGGALGEVGQRPRQGLQREPEGIQGRAHLQGQLPRDADRRHRRLPLRQRARHPAGVRGGYGNHDGQQGRHRAGGQGDEGFGPEVRPHGLRLGRRRLLHGTERSDAQHAVQQLDHDLLLQQGRVQGRRPRPQQAAGHLGRSRARRGQAQGERPGLPLHHQLDQLDPARELLGLAQRGVRDQGQRHGRHRYAPQVQRPPAGAPHSGPGEHGQAGPLRLQGPRQQGRTPPSPRASAP